ncbi:MAG: hypothetical protein IJ037_13910, partial [Clostridia bacterium]|nr:hypothetical protein [Clostridia bacterium]
MNKDPKMNGKMPPPPNGKPPMPGTPGGKPGDKKEMTADELRAVMKKNGTQQRGPGGPMIREKPKDAKGTLLKLIKYIGRSKYLVLAVVGTTILSTFLNLLGPNLQGRAIDAITVTAGKPSVDFDELIRVLMLMLLVYLGSAAIQMIQGIASAKITQKYILAVFAAGFPHHLSHAAATAVTMLLFTVPLLKKLDRMKRK